MASLSFSSEGNHATTRLSACTSRSRPAHRAARSSTAPQPQTPTANSIPVAWRASLQPASVSPHSASQRSAAISLVRRCSSRCAAPCASMRTRCPTCTASSITSTTLIPAHGLTRTRSRPSTPRCYSAACSQRARTSMTMQRSTTLPPPSMSVSIGHGCSTVERASRWDGIRRPAFSARAGTNTASS